MHGTILFSSKYHFVFIYLKTKRKPKPKNKHAKNYIYCLFPLVTQPSTSISTPFPLQHSRSLLTSLPAFYQRIITSLFPYSRLTVIATQFLSA